MDLRLERIQADRKIHSAFCASNHIVEVRHDTEKGFIIAVSKWENDENGGAKFVDTVSKWERPKKEKFGTCAAYDVKSSLLYASLEDRRRIITLGIGQRALGSSIESAIQEVQFESQIFSLISLRCNESQNEGDVVFAVSSTGEIECFCSTGNGELARRVLDSVPVTTVLHVSTFASDHLIIVGTCRSRVVVHPIRVRMTSGFHSMKVEQFPAVKLPTPPAAVAPSLGTKDGFVLDFVLTKNFACVLYHGGYVHILKPEVESRKGHAAGLLAWYKKEQDGIPQSDIDLGRPAYAFRLSPGTLQDNSVSIGEYWKGVKEDAGGVVVLPGNYIAIGYGCYVSVWDGLYGVGHAFSELNGKVTAAFTEQNTWNVVVGSEKGFDILDVTNKSPASLGLAVQRKGSCDPIVKPMKQSSEVAPIHSQPVAVDAMRLAAETGGSTDRVFRPLLEALDAKQTKMVRALVDRSVTGTPEAVAKLTCHYTTELRKVRRGNRGRAADLGLAKLPSERLASVSVARCLYEVHFGNVKYVVPLIDMIGTGVVSSEAVLPVFGLSDSWNMGPGRGKLLLDSIVEPLLSSVEFINGLEAIICRVGDLPETDVVRVVQFAVQLIEERLVSPASVRPQADNYEITSDPVKRKELAQALRLLLRCFHAPMDKKRAIAALRQIPFSDALAVLANVDRVLQGGSFVKLLSSATLPLAPPSIRRGFFSGNSFDEACAASYRGVGNWLDTDEQNPVGQGTKVQTEGCVAWGAFVIDAHLATLIMDDAGSAIAGRLLKTVRQRRKQCETLRSLQGLISHLTSGAALPTQKNKMHKISMLEVPGYASLK